ncbi:MAG: F0F1 ATP synthase subunit delta [Armatimonadota bacterium]
MIPRRLVRKYAMALLNAAHKSNVVDQVESDLGLVSYVLESEPNLLRVVSSPTISRRRKKAILEDIFGGRIHPLTQSFLDLLVEKSREEILSAIEPEYVELANSFRGVVKAEVTAAVELLAEERERLVRKLSEITDKKIVLLTQVDPSIIGGLIVKIGDTLIDGSIRCQLAAIKSRLAGKR